MKTIVFDLDGVICTQTEGDYDQAVPDTEAIATINRLYDEGYRIVINTSRFMGRTKHNLVDAYRQGYDFTLRQLEGWNVKFHELYLGKPACDVLIDDRSVFFRRDWRAIYDSVKNI